MNRTIVRNGIITFTTEVEIEECIDVDVRVKLADVLDDLIDGLDDDQMALIASKAGLNVSPTFEGDGFKRHLCDMLDLGYHSDKSKILNAINDRLS